jgi:hypothetical protein
MAIEEVKKCFSIGIKMFLHLDKRSKIPFEVIENIFPFG